jgi:hypothetical protein
MPDFVDENFVWHVKGMTDVACRYHLRIKFPDKTLSTRKIRVVGEGDERTQKMGGCAMISLGRYAGH